ncbi:nitroreductase family protein [Rhodopirellula sp. MGV]|uniref:nitroreductase family protein n=1 Tax=Rhodopirellula sp. MGV TaxID=2023130 RepID=UPI000B97825F|nr:nitroreductase family protein [Rhodopirellula sp. MGV]OYP34730.1 hypothetical protein CGZ80_13960 [Rhodopirellula sp. MGV]PNY34315.1 nitroreductase [Rhodopirellula baltica]
MSAQDQSASNKSSDLDRVAKVIAARKTLKVLGDPADPIAIATEVASVRDAQVLDALRVAGMAPFHYDRAIDSIAEPWRAHVIWNSGCRDVANRLPEWIGAEQSAGKLPAMFAACGAAVLITWLPQFRDQPSAKPEQIDVDDEHLAASSAMVQNLLVLLTAAGMGTYWSSGGVVKQPSVSQQFGIGSNEKLLAVVFVEYPETMSAEIERKPGKHRDSRSDRWIKQVKL